MGQREALALFLPLEKTNWITCGNALRLDWLSICPPTGVTSVKLQGDDLFNTPLKQSEIDFENEGGETYICGNPPYVGYNKQTKEQKYDLKTIFDNHTNRWKSLDYVSGWFAKASQLSSIDFSSGLVATNSVNQGEHATILWPVLFKFGVEITYGVPDFKWSNNASKNAGVSVSIIGLARPSNAPKMLYNGDRKRTCESINQYLLAGKKVAFDSSSAPLFGKNSMLLGNMPKDGGNLILSKSEVDKLLDEDFLIDRFVHRFFGSQEFIKGSKRYCLWIKDADLEEAAKYVEISRRLRGVAKMRNDSPAASTKAYAKYPNRFKQIQGVGQNWSIIIPSVSSESRPYLPVGLLPTKSIVSSLAFALYDAPLWNMALIASKLHLVWIATVCGKLETRYRYSNTLGWNTFPVPKLTTKNKADLTRAAENILLAREAHFPATIAELYKPKSDKHPGMPENLRAAHNENDRILEEIYIGRRFKNDTERLEKLFEMYTEMTKKVRN